MEAFIENATIVRAFFSIGGLLLFWGLALAFPFRKSSEIMNYQRWITNLVFNFGNGLALAVFVPFSLIQISYSSTMDSFSILSFSQLSGAGIILGIVLLDLAIYWQHRWSHSWNWLWKLHRMHHSDIEFDTTTAGRFHILEILLSLFYKASLVIIFDISAASILIFEILLNLSSIFNHSNFSLPKTIETFLQKILITPDLHRVHHSTVGEEMNSNFGFSVSWWDMIFDTFKKKPKEDPQRMKIGLEDFRLKQEQSFYSLLTQPLKD